MFLGYLGHVFASAEMFGAISFEDTIVHVK